MLTVVKKELTNRIIVENKSDLVDYLYFLALDIWEINNKSENSTKQTRVGNVYDI